MKETKCFNCGKPLPVIYEQNGKLFSEGIFKSISLNKLFCSIDCVNKYKDRKKK